MKKLSILFVIILIGLTSCTKSDNNSSNANFNITGIHDVDLTTSSTANFTLPIAIVSTTTTAETVELTFSDLPAGLNVDFTPATGTTPFTSSVRFTYDYSGTGGIYPITIKGTGPSGTKSYTMNITLGDYRGWRFGGVQYDKTGLNKYPGNQTQYSSILVNGGGSGRLTINFGQGRSFPKANKTYKITSGADSSDNIQITMQDVTMLYISTGKSTNGVNPPTGTFTFDTLGKFTFKCTDVEMSDGLSKQTLSASFSE